MRILIIHNEYGALSGEEVMLNHSARLLTARGHVIHRYTRSSQEIDQRSFGKTHALLNGVFSRTARRDIRGIIKSFRPDVAIVQNVFPLISPAVLPVLRKAGVPVVMFVSNYRLICPNGLFFTHGKVCERCSGGREFHCVLQNCEGSLAKSFGYALRSWTARKAGWYKNNVVRFVCPTQFLKQKLMKAGFDESRLDVIPNHVPDPVSASSTSFENSGSYVAYAGRISREKGILTLLKAARLCPDIEFRIAGRLNIPQNLLEPVPGNVKFVGFFVGQSLVEFISRAGLVVSTSECYETFGMTVAEAMLCARPVIVSRIGVFPELVQDGVAGLLFEPGDSTQLADQIRRLWADPELCHSMGANGRAKALRDYSEAAYYASLSATLAAATDSVGTFPRY